MNRFEEFTNLHNQNGPLVLGNVWNVQSALLFEKLGFKAIGTSSAAIATSLGYEDGEHMPFNELVRIVKSIQTKINIPLTVDIEGGYSRDIPELINNIKTLNQLGIVGINLEDSVYTNKREIMDAEKFSEIVRKISTDLSENNIDLFLNIRTDFYLMGLENPLEETLKRIKLYEKSGADGIFVPCVVKEDEIEKMTKITDLPINVISMPDLPSFDKLNQLGVKRISMGQFLYYNSISVMESLLKDIIVKQSFNSLFS
ncbi:isocitrate lyase/PEP mutase family protein [Psychroserpens sp.]